MRDHMLYNIVLVWGNKKKDSDFDIVPGAFKNGANQWKFQVKVMIGKYVLSNPRKSVKIYVK